MTTSDYYATRETVLPQELIYGRFRVSDAPRVPHQTAVLDICLALDAYVRPRDLGRLLVSPLDVVLDEARALVVQPDVVFVSHARWHVEDGRLHVAPDLVVEVLSPRPRVGDTEGRVALYATYGVGECWIVRLADRQIEVVAFGGGWVRSRRVFTAAQPLESSALPAFRLTPGEILRSS